MLLTAGRKTISLKTFFSKKEGTAIDREHYFRTFIDNLMVRSSWAETVKKLSGITGVSQVWGRQPEWYIWISGKPGPFALVLEHCAGGKTGSHDYHQGLFTVKCFPYPQHVVFKSFSEAEQQFLQSSRFDRTNTPVYEARPEIPPSFFNIASLMVTSYPQNGITVFTIESLDTIRLVKTCNTGSASVTDMTHTDTCLLRNVPGWEIGYPLFDSLISLYAFSFRQAPQWFRLSRLPGFEHALMADETIIMKACSTNRVFSASLVFAEDPTDKANQWLPMLEEGEEIQFESRLVHCTRFSGDIPNPHINPLWWHLAEADIGSELSSLCGCCDHGHQTCSCDKPGIAAMAGRFKA